MRAGGLGPFSPPGSVSTTKPGKDTQDDNRRWSTESKLCYNDSRANLGGEKRSLGMQTLTISRELGSLGTSIAHAVAKRLGYRWVWREVINEAASRVGSPEIALSQIDDLGLLGLRPSERSLEAYHQVVKSIIEGLAAEGRVVIVGRAGQVILRDDPTVFHIKILAPLDLRIERIASERNISRKLNVRSFLEQKDRLAC